MNHNVYLPDEISERAKAAELNLSRLLRDAVTDELKRRALRPMVKAAMTRDELVQLNELLQEALP
jgi:hypothetical protein